MSLENATIWFWFGASQRLEHDRELTVVTIGVEVPDNVFKREPRAVLLQGVLKSAPNVNPTDTINHKKEA